MASIDGMEFTSVKAALEANDKRIEELEAALRPFAEYDPHLVVDNDEAVILNNENDERKVITRGDFRAAGAALRGPT